MLLTHLSMTTLRALPLLLYIHTYLYIQSNHLKIERSWLQSRMTSRATRECVKEASAKEAAVFAQVNLTTHHIVHLVFNACSQCHLWPANAGGAEFTPHR